MARIFCTYDPAIGDLTIVFPLAKDEGYLVWVDDILIGRADGMALRDGVRLSPLYRLINPGTLQLQPTTGAQASWGFIWLHEPTSTDRARIWARGRNVSHCRAAFLAKDALPPADVQRSIVETINSLTGEYFDSFCTAIFADEPAHEPDRSLTVDVQMQIVTRGLSDADAVALLTGCFLGYAPKVLIPLDAESARLAAQSDSLPMILGPWLEGFDDISSGHGLRFRWQNDNEFMPAIFGRVWTELALPRAPSAQPMIQTFVANCLGPRRNDVLPQEHHQNFLARLVELDAPVTLLLGKGVSQLETLRTLSDVRTTTLEFDRAHRARRYRGGFPADPFEWSSFAGRWLVYIGQDQDLDAFLAAQCRLRGQAYRSVFTLLHAQDGSAA